MGETNNKTEKKQSLLDTLDQIDKKYSKIIHDLDSKLLTTILYPFARIFNP